MKILILSFHGNLFDHNDSINYINCLSGIYAYFFKKYLENKKFIVDVKDINIDLNSIDIYDHCIITVNRGTNYVSNFNLLRSKISKKIITICETSSIIGEEDYLIHYVGKRKPKSIRINWMADHYFLHPQKSADKIIILVDHKYYGDKNTRIFNEDKTEFIVNSLLEYKKNNPSYNNKEIIIKHIMSNQVITIQSSEDIKNSNFRQGNALSYGNIAKYYNECDIFINTHYESMGLTNLECAMAGALILTFNGFLKKEFIKNLYHVIVDPNNIVWNNIFSMIDPIKSRDSVICYNYENNVNFIADNYLK